MKNTNASNLIKDFWSSFLEMDYKFVRTLKEIIIRPDYVINEYVDGNKELLTSPIKMLFFITTFLYFIIRFLEIRFYNNILSDVETESVQMAVAVYHYLIFLIVVPSSLFFKWIYGSGKTNLVSSYYSVCYILSGYMLLTIPLALTHLFIDIRLDISRKIVLVLYTLYVTKKLYKLDAFSALWKTSLFLICFFISGVIVLILVVLLARTIDYEPLLLPGIFG